jgi:hypothetical protein
MKAAVRMSRLKVDAPLAVYWNDKADLAAKVDYTDQFIQVELFFMRWLYFCVPLFDSML